MQNYKKYEKEAQELWKKRSIFKAEQRSDKPKYYCLDMFPYPSGDGLHVGHAKGYFASDIIARYKILKGFNVLHPMGWDAFGLPAENYAIKIGKHPRKAVSKNIDRFKKQMQNLGLSYDWSREINTTDPKYYKWTQWIFLKMFKRKLAYEAKIPISFCPSCKTGLANEEVVGGVCERCGTRVVKKEIKQWVLKITDFAKRLLDGLETLDWPDPIIEMQKNWIGRSVGTLVKFKIAGSDETIDVFTTRVDTIFSGTFLIIAPESEQINKLKNKIRNFDEVSRYIFESKAKTDLERTSFDREKKGVELRGIEAINPATKEKIPIWTADFVLASYGTGAVFADAHDERDFEMAKKYNISLKVSIRPDDEKLWDKVKNLEVCFEGEGTLVNSDEFDGLTSAKAREKITSWLEQRGLGKKSVQYKLRDWIFSRQRYWGEPIPVIHCEKCGVVPVPEGDLPVELPYVDKYEPTGTGESPLAGIADWVNVKCPKCEGKGRRETNTMPNWAGSCWYYLRYIDANLNNAPWRKDDEKYFMPVDLYIGGAEHAVLHLLYARFWHKVLYDEKLVSENEPFKKLQNVGLILAPDGRKMSKSLGNVINPETITDEFGIDAFRLYEAFMGPFDQSAAWNTSGINGTKRFIDKVLGLSKGINTGEPDEKIDEYTDNLAADIEKKIEKLLFNTAVSDFMKFVNLCEGKQLTREQLEKFLLVLSPFAPHTAEFIWQKLGNIGSIFENRWPEYFVRISRKVLIVIQINGKKLSTLEMDRDLSDNEAVDLTKSDKRISGRLKNKIIKNTISVKNKLVNFITE